MLLVTGKVDKITEREAGTPGNTWIERTIIVRDWGQTLYITATRDFVADGLPNEGDMVALNVGVRAYVKRNTGGAEPQAGVGYNAFGRNSEAEAALFPEATKGLRTAV